MLVEALVEAAAAVEVEADTESDAASALVVEVEVVLVLVVLELVLVLVELELVLVLVELELVLVLVELELVLVELELELVLVEALALTLALKLADALTLALKLADALKLDDVELAVEDEVEPTVVVSALADVVAVNAPPTKVAPTKPAPKATLLNDVPRFSSFSKSFVVAVDCETRLNSSASPLKKFNKPNRQSKELIQPLRVLYSFTREVRLVSATFF